MSFFLEKNNLPCWGLTGGIGSGKSTVAKIWIKLQNISLIDIDSISHSLTATGGDAIDAIAKNFGCEFIEQDTHSLNRTKMRQYVFGDSEARQKLESIIHPLIHQKVQQAVTDSTQHGYDAALLDIPLLVESGFWQHQLDAVIVVDCSVATQIQRVQARNQLSIEAIEAIIAAQATREQRLAIADVVIDNGENVTLASLEAAVQSAIAYLTQRFQIPFKS